MAEIKKYKVIFQFRRATTKEWGLNEDEIPYAGEPCYDMDLGTLKIGDGRTTYRDLKTISSVSISDDGLSLIVDNLRTDVVGLKALVGDIFVEHQIADAIAGIVDEIELQDVLNSVLNN